jgi:hypothetical protein
LTPAPDPRDARLAELEAQLRSLQISPVGRTQGQLGICQKIFEGANPARPGKHQCDLPIDHKGAHHRAAPEGGGAELELTGF